MTIRQADIDTLREGAWLNDSVISLYLDYLVEQKTTGNEMQGKV